MNKSKSLVRVVIVLLVIGLVTGAVPITNDASIPVIGPDEAVAIPWYGYVAYVACKLGNILGDGLADCESILKPEFW